ncbi:hypothetical protein BC834DRAFT_891824 [Gloeopeniophorella convolvens]|nr:hypothetical protein BC834DRAFT_891824 [Gloeopeniophorella convolvens]
MPSPHAYSSLPQDPDDSDAASELDALKAEAAAPGTPPPRPTASTPAGTSPWARRLARGATLVLALCTLLDGLALLYLGARYALHARAPGAPSCAPSDLDALPLRSSYIGFDALYGERGEGALRPSPHAPIRTRALALGHVSRARAHARVTRDAGGGMTINGYVPLDGGWVWATPDDVSTIAQFRAIDYGMENCTLALVLPGGAAEAGAEPEPEPDAGELELDVWALEAAPRLNAPALTWATRPPRRTHVGALRVRRGGGRAGETPAFACDAGSWHTFEVSCAAGPGCAVDVLGVGLEGSGLYLKQYQTLV